MTVETGLRARLVADAAVSALVVARVYPLKLPQEEPLPAVVFQRIGENSEYSHDGASGLVWVRMQIDAFANTASEIFDLRRAIKLALTGLKGDMGGFPVQAVFFLNAVDDWEPKPGPQSYRTALDFQIWHAEGIP